jgi:alpha-L-rhamnosidase
MLTSFPPDGGPAWADAAIICPWTMYLTYEDTRILETNYEVMTRFMDFLLETSPGFVRCAPDYDGWHGFGDWLSINASTPRDLIGVAFFAYDAHLMARIASILGKSDAVMRYQRLATDIKKAFTERFLVGSETPVFVTSHAGKQLEEADRLSHGTLKTIDYGTIVSEVFNTALFTPTQTAYVLALRFDLLSEELRPLAAAELVADIERRGMHLSTGFVGSPYLPHVLSENGHLDIAYALLDQKSWPSWLYAVTQGATTIWERWDGWTEENGFQTPEMNSFNHYAYGAIGAWLYNTVAGIELDPEQPGYKHSILRPQPGGGLTYASATLKTPYGELVSRWKIEGGKFEWTVVVPANTRATLHVPSTANQKIMLNGEPVTGASHEVEAGRYHFVLD